MRRIAVLSACVLAGSVVVPTTALATDGSGSEHGTDSWIAVEDAFAVVLPDGTTFTDDTEPAEGEDEEEVAPVGTRLFISEVLYESADGDTRGDVIGRTHIECTAQVVPANFACDIVWALDDGSQLYGTVVVDFAAEDPDAPSGFDIAVIGGTGDYSSATGVVSFLDTTDPADPEAETTALYQPHLGHS